MRAVSALPARLVLAALAVAAPPQGDAPDAGPREAELERVERLAAELAALGLALDVDELSVEVLARDACRADVDRQQELLFAPGHFDAARTLLESLGLGGGLSGHELRAVTVEALLDSLRAYYQWDRRALVLVDGAGPAGAGAGPGDAEERDRAWLHELAHAWQDAELSVAELFGAEPRTTERARLVQTLLEGHAEAVALGALLARRGLELAEFDADEGEERLGQLVAGAATTLPYRHGLQLFVDAHRAGGWEAVASRLRAPPASTEQLLHPAKLGADEPTDVAAPAAELAAWPRARPQRRDVVGELTLLALLLEAGTGTERATLAATGWDGDRLVTWRGPPPPADGAGETAGSTRADRENGESAADGSEGEAPAEVEGLTWRTVWDRERDAEQFAEVLGELFAGTLRRNGRVVDAAWAGDPRAQAALADALAATEPPAAADDRDGASTERLEAAWLAQQPVRVAEHWVLPRHGLRVPIPAGWAVREVRGVAALKRVTPLEPRLGAAGAPFDDNVSVVASRNARELSLEQLARLNEQGLEDVEYLALDASVRLRVAGRDAFLLRYHGRPPRAAAELGFVTLGFLRGEELVTVTGTARRDRWARVGPVLEAALRGVEVEDE